MDHKKFQHKSASMSSQSNDLHETNSRSRQPFWMSLFPQSQSTYYTESPLPLRAYCTLTNVSVISEALSAATLSRATNMPSASAYSAECLNCQGKSISDPLGCFEEIDKNRF
ncbi:hypothetical protein PoB_005457900 [Plakobranchus ocellatus]|uniref:Uncharacterized protein n=1 Tax=Plakobranchus ocellatus TaxID=259542 RepID=A0AAV4CAJ3_9GAST|nr:hypothetical protein PoB_005457900 [Plakobranchus ocellatus]